MGDSENPNSSSDPLEKGEQPPFKKMEIDPEGNNTSIANSSASVTSSSVEILATPAAEITVQKDVAPPEVSNDVKEPLPPTPIAETVEMIIEEPKEELVELKVMFNKKIYPIKISLHKTVGDLKKLIEVATKVSPALQKVLVKGASNDQATLKSIKMTNGQKFLVIGSSIDDVMAVAKPPDVASLVKEDANGSKINDSQNWCTLTQHRKIIDKGVPDDAMPGIGGDEMDPLPPIPLHGMLSSKGAKVRLTFKLESDELWIGTKERTEKIAISTIRSVVSQPITGFEHYHILAIQLGPTEASRFYVYWVPAQYVEAIKEVLGG